MVPGPLDDRSERDAEFAEKSGREKLHVMNRKGLRAFLGTCLVSRD